MPMNYARTALLLAMLTAIFVAMGALIGGQQGMLIAFAVALVMNVFSLWNADKMVLRMYGAQEVDERSAPGYYGMVRDLAARAELPMPRVYVMDSPQPNAFATGRSPSRSAVCASTGLLDTLSEEEVAGVMAHELAHIRNRDTLTMTVAATIGGAISMLAQSAVRHAVRRPPRRPQRRRLDRRAARDAGRAVRGHARADGDQPLARVPGRPPRGDDLRQPLWLASALRKIQVCAPHPQRGGRSGAGDGAHVHHQPADGPRRRQLVLDTRTRRTASPSSRRWPRKWGRARHDHRRGRPLERQPWPSRRSRRALGLIRGARAEGRQVGAAGRRPDRAPARRPETALHPPRSPGSPRGSQWPPRLGLRDGTPSRTRRTAPREAARGPRRALAPRRPRPCWRSELAAVLGTYLDRPLPARQGRLWPILLAAAAQLLVLGTPPCRGRARRRTGPPRRGRAALRPARERRAARV